MRHCLTIIIFFLFYRNASVFAQQDSIKSENGAAADDPSQFFTRIELFNELQHYQNDVFLNFTTLRTVVKIRQRFTTRLDIPVVHNSFSTDAGYKQTGLGDISFRLLGYRFFQSNKSAITASIEISLNTAQSPLLGTGKNLVIPLLSYTSELKEKKMFLALTLQQVNSFSGDDARERISFSKIQAFLINVLSRRSWVIVVPEWYIDYVHGGLSMNLKGRGGYAPSGRINVWLQCGAGIFGDFKLKYEWATEMGCRYFLMRNSPNKKKSSN